MSPSSSLLPKNTPNVKFSMELSTQIQDSPSSLAHLDANLMLNIGDTPNDKIRYAYRFGDDFGYPPPPPPKYTPSPQSCVSSLNPFTSSGASPGTESASSVQRYIRSMPKGFPFTDLENHRSENGSPDSQADAQYTLSDHNIGINSEDAELATTFGQSRLAAGTPVAEAGGNKSKLRFCSCRRSLCLKVIPLLCLCVLAELLTRCQLYCECFSTGRLCSSQCKCNNCHNDVAHSEERMAAARHILQRNPTAFSPKIQEDGNDARLAPTPTGQEAVRYEHALLEWPWLTCNINLQQLAHVRGCHCKKSGCLKRYCECFQAGVICGPHCKCTNWYEADLVFLRSPVSDPPMAA